MCGSRGWLFRLDPSLLMISLCCLELTVLKEEATDSVSIFPIAAELSFFYGDESATMM